MKIINVIFRHFLLTLTLAAPTLALGNANGTVKTIREISLSAQNSNLITTKLMAIEDIGRFLESQNTLMINDLVRQEALSALGYIPTSGQFADTEVPLAALRILETYVLSWHGESVRVSAAAISRIGSATKTKRVIEKLDEITKKLRISGLPGRADIAENIEQTYTFQKFYQSELLID